MRGRPRPRTLAAWTRSLEHADVVAIAFLVALPIALYVPSSLIGHPVVPGDNLLQNEPLRVLAGEVIRSGRLPAWDPLIWSGTPLLAGWNAGALFPGTWLFAVLPSIAAWTLNYVSAPALCGVGTYLFFRRHHATPKAALLGAALFTYTGFMNGQVVHIGLLQGTALTPWVLLGLDEAPSPDRRRRLLGAALAGTAFGGIVLAGDPRAVSSALVFAIVEVVALCWRHRDAFGRLLGVATLAGVLGAATSAVQWLPGLAFLRASQRSAHSYAFYASGSLGFHQLLRGMLVPFLTGATGNLGLPSYQGDYNFPELTIGVGLVALVAAVTYLPAWVGDVSRFFHRRPADHLRRPYGRAYALIVIGALLTLGSFTPLGHLFSAIPLFGGERLQNRNAVLVDFALAWLCCFLIDDAGGPLAERPRPRRMRPLNVLAALVPLAAGGLTIAGLIDPARVEAALHYAPASPSVIREMAPMLVPMAILAAALAVVVLAAPYLSHRRRWLAFVVLVGCDLASFVVNVSFGSAPAIVLATTNPLAATLQHLTGPHGRFAIFNPAYAQGGPSPDTLPELGVTDLNILHGQGSVQGYGSIVNGVYQTFTGTHLFQDLNTRALRGESFNTLDLTTLLSPSMYFAEVLPPGQVAPLAMPPDATHRAPWATGGLRAAAPVPYQGGPWPIDGVHAAYFVLPAPTALRSITVSLDPLGRPLPASVAVSVGSATTLGAPVRVPVRGHHATLALPRHRLVEVVKVADPHVSAAEIGAVVAVTTAPTQRLLLDGALQGRLVPGHWTYQTNLGDLVVFHNDKVRGPAWLQSATSRTPDTKRAIGPVTVRSDDPVDPQVLSYSSSVPAELVRSEGYAPGWRADLVPSGGGRSIERGVHRFGLVQAISVPAGSYTVTFHYQPTSLLAGFLLSALGTFGLILLIGYCWMMQRGKGRSRAPTRRRGPTYEHADPAAATPR